MLEQDRADWLAVNAESFGGAKCPTCGQELPMEQLQKARDSFEANKAKRLDGIRQMADIHKGQAEKNRTYAKRDREQLENVNLALDQAMADLMEAEKVPTEIRDMEGYQVQKEAAEARLEELQGMQFMDGYREKHDELEAELKAIPGDWTEYAARRAAIEVELSRESDEKARSAQEAEKRVAALSVLADQEKAKLAGAEAILRGKLTLEGIHKRMDELREELKRTAAELEQVDRLAFGLEEYIRWKTRFIEDSVNGLFRFVTFRLFKELISGGLEECCDVVVDGVPYNALNNGARVNAGMDIIRRLAEHYGVRVPLIVDNAECVTRLEDAGTQVIRLVVSEQDKVLRVETV
jgi:DNA repair exonuclease SbcCD ATPase subunit